MTEAHLVVGVAVLALNLLAGAWGGISWLAERPSVFFWYALRIAQAAVIAQMGLGVALIMSGREPTEGLHYVYGIAPLAVTLFAEAARATAAAHEIGDLDFDELDSEQHRSIAVAIVRREMGIMAVSALVIFGLALRAGLTSTAV